MAATKLELIENRRSELQAAFLAFGSVSDQLSGAFESLRGQVAQLRADLGGGARRQGTPGGAPVCARQGPARRRAGARRRAARSRNSIRRLATCWANRCSGSVSRRYARARHVNPRGSGEHTELRSGRFVNVSRRELDNGGEVVLLTDVTESHLMQVLLARQQRLLTLGELAAGLAHQIRTPLAAALLYASQMTLSGRSPADLARCAEKTVSSLKQLDKLVNDMLAFAQGGAAREAVSVSALLEQVAQWLRPALRDGIRLTIRTQAPNLMVRANAPSLVSAVLNLATNALQAASGAAEFGVTGAAQRRRAARRSLSATTGPASPRKSASAFSNLSLPRARAATASDCPSSNPWSRRTAAACIWPTRAAAPRSSSNFRQRIIHEQTRNDAVLVVEDDAALREALLDTLQAAGLAALAAHDAPRLHCSCSRTRTSAW